VGNAALLQTAASSFRFGRLIGVPSPYRPGTGELRDAHGHDPGVSRLRRIARWFARCRSNEVGITTLLGTWTARARQA